MSVVAAIAVTFVCIARDDNKYRLFGLSMALWGLSLFVFVDHVIGWLNDGSTGEFFEIGADAFLLGISMLAVIFAVWEVYLVTDRLKARAVCDCSAVQEV